MAPNVAECFRVTLWVDPEPPCLAPAGQVGLDTSDAAHSIRLNPGVLEPASISIGDLFEIVPLLNQGSSTPETPWATAPRWQHEPGFIFGIHHHTLIRQQGLQVSLPLFFVHVLLGICSLLPYSSPDNQLSIPIAIAKAFDLERFNRHDVLLRKVGTSVLYQPSPVGSIIMFLIRLHLK
jgi:hypothetical protein